MSALYTVVLLCLTTVDALQNGYVKPYIKDRFCHQKTGLINLPWDCTGYLHCYTLGRSTSAVWINCPNHLQFDRRSRTCVNEVFDCANMTSVAHRWCPIYTHLHFPHHRSCAMYYDCEQTTVWPKYDLKMYENECPFPMMFDPETAVCTPDPNNKIECHNRPRTRCEYKKECVEASTECYGVADGYAPKPTTIFTSEYIHCNGGQLVAKLKCKVSEEIFDPVSMKCTSHYQKSIIMYCINNPKVKFADPMNCARYYDCSSRYHHFGLLPYQSECPYRYLFDVITNTCQLFDMLKNPCVDKFEPKAPCEYKIGRCLGLKYCMACSASCVGQEDGEIPYPGIPRTRFHLYCRGERTIEIQECPKGHIFDGTLKACTSDDDETTTTTTTSTTTTSTTTTTTTTTPTTTTTTPLITTTTTTKLTTPTTPSINFLIFLQKLQELTDFAQSLADRMQTKPRSPYDCVSPPSLQNSVIQMSYDDDVAVADYTCDDGYAMCGNVQTRTCRGDDSWDQGSLAKCVPDSWIDLPDSSIIDLACLPEVGKTIVIKGRYKSHIFHFNLTSEDGSDMFLYLAVRPWEGLIESARDSMSPKKSHILAAHLLGELTWNILLKEKVFEVWVNGEQVASVDHGTTMTNIRKVRIGPDFQTDLVKIGYYDVDRVSSVKKPVQYNLALHKLTSSSTSIIENDRVVTSNNVVDGNTNVHWEGGSCWSVLPGDLNPWWQVDLGKTYYLSHLIIASRQCAGQCGDRLHDFGIMVYKEDPFMNEEAIGQTCTTYNGIFPDGEIQRLNCTSDVVGQYVRISGLKTSNFDMLTLCEVEVFGGIIKETGWTPFTCPNPPPVKGAAVHLSYTTDKAFANYKCNGNDVMCIGTDVITCSSKDGWEEDPGKCIETYQDAGIGGKLDDFPICPLDLGAGVELWVTPKGTKESLVWHSYNGPVFSIEFDFNDLGKPVGLSHATSGIWSPKVYPTAKPFIVGRESHIIMTFLSDYLYIEVDDDILYKYPLDDVDIHKAVLLTPTDGLHIRKAKIHDENIFDVIRKPVAENLALKAHVDVSSTFGNPAWYGVDGNTDDDGRKGSCWHANIGDTNQWFQVDLGKHYFVRHIQIDNTDQCVGCETTNVALFKETFGSENYDFRSSHDNPVNGNLVADHGSCFISTTTETSPWWMVDLGKAYDITSVSLQRQKGGNPDQLSDMSVHVYPTNPMTGLSARPLVCAEKVGPLGDFDNLVCDSPVNGRFVRVQRMPGVNKGSIALCEVQVFALVIVENRLHNITVDIFVDNPETDSSAVPKPCVHNEEDVPAGGPQILQCHDDVWGRFVKIKSDLVFDQHDQMTICEVEVYGDKPVKKVWSPLDCPSPPLVDDTRLTLSYTSTEAYATYSCDAGFSSCDGEDSIVCTDNGGWSGSVAPCRRTLFTSQDENGLQWISGFCRLKLGDAVEMTISPRAPTSSIKFMSVENGDMIMMMIIEFIPKAEVRLLTGPVNPTTVPIIIQDVVFSPDTESKITFTFLTDHVDIAVDGKSIYSYPTYKMSFHWIDNVIFHETVTRRVVIKPARTNAVLQETLSNNLAMKRPAAGSSTSLGNHESVVDGRDMEMEMSNSCWSSKSDDFMPWWKVDLEKYYFITHVDITSRNDCGGMCPEKLHDFIVEVFYDDPKPSDKGDVCVTYNGMFPHSTKKTVACTKTVFGRYLRVSPQAMTPKDQPLILCEVQVFGGRITLEDWNSFKCPNPPLLADASVQVSYSLKRATATYTCNNKYTMCSGNDVIYCTDDKHWVDAPGKCLLTTKEFHSGDPNEFPTCRPKLGEGIEVWITPKENKGDLNFMDFVHGDSIMTIKLDIGNTGVSLTDSYDGKSVGTINRSFNPFALNKEAHVIIIFLTEGILVLVNEDILIRFDGYAPPAMMDYVKATPSLQLRKTRLVPRYREGIVRARSPQNLALNKLVINNIEPGTGAQEANFTTDGNLSLDGMFCWVSSEAHTKPWVMVDLYHFYFIREVKIYNRQECPGCVGTLRDFTINIHAVHHTDDLTDTCGYYRGIFPPGGVETIYCEENVWGRYVTVIFPTVGSEVFTLCEIEVYGDDVSRKTGQE